ncbi:MAG TPA: hypothetical protein VKA49_08450 [Flavitalea sp.]|nr:hypothetical protein [Flavitalea sp.]
MSNQHFINRRDFISQSTALASVSLLSLHGFSNFPFANYKMGLQLFTIRGPLANDVPGTIKKIAAVGYEDSETYGFDPAQVKYYGLKASVFKQLLCLKT